METEEIAQEITTFMDDKVKDLADVEWKEVLGEVESNINTQLQAKEEEEENAN